MALDDHVVWAYFEFPEDLSNEETVEVSVGAGGEHQHHPLINCELIIVLVCGSLHHCTAHVLDSLSLSLAPYNKKYFPVVCCTVDIPSTGKYHKSVAVLQHE